MVTSGNTHDDEDEHGAGNEQENHFIFEEFQLWNQIPSTMLLFVIISLGSVTNIFVTYCIYKKKVGTKYVNPVLLAISLKNLIAITTCVPLAIVMIIYPSSILKLTCDIQENITFIILFAGFLFPALLSIVQCDHIIKPHKHILGGKRIIISICVISTISVLMGVQSKLVSDDHGCHLWSVITDKVVLTYIYSILFIVLLTLVTMVSCYMVIYNQARARQTAVESSIQGATSRPSGLSNGKFGNDAKEEQGVLPVAPLRRKMTTAILKPMFCIVISNIVTSFPWIILYAFTVYDHIESSLNYAEGRILTMAIMYIPIASDPIIFLSFSTKGRQAVRTIFRRGRATINPLPNTATLTRQGMTERKI